MIKLENISFGYLPGKEVIRNIRFSVEKGETLAIVGASGSGKSTILRLIAGILPNNSKNTYSGDLKIEGKTPINYIKEGKLAFMFQEPTLFPNLTVEQNIEVPLKIKNIQDQSKVNDLINIVGLNGFENYLPKDLSGGMKTRVSLARSFTTNPELLLLDEPFSSLDIGWKQNLYTELQNIRINSKVTVLMVTHDIQEAIYLADSIIVLGRNGSIIDNQIINKKLRMPIDKLSDVPEIYPHELSKIQNLITIDSIRRNYNINSFGKIIEELRTLTGKEEIDYTHYDNLLIPLREMSHNENINEMLIELYKIANLKQRFSLVWDIFQIQQPLEFTNSVFDEIYNNLDEFNMCCKSFYKANEDNILSIIQNRINSSNENSPSSKKWLYLCNLLLSSDIAKTESILVEVKNGMINTLEYPFSKKVAEKLLMKVYEKKDIIHIY